jgi:hypothetical protein
MRNRLLLTCVLVLAACAGRPSADDPLLSDAELELERFFDGDLVAHGQFQDRFGEVRRRFEVAITGRWDGRTLRLAEDFTYSDGTTEERVWLLTKTGDETWTGTADGVIGAATGEERGDSFNWRYTIDLPTPQGVTRVSFDDWMWKLDDRRLLNRAYMRKYGVTLGEVIIFFEKLR